MNSSEKDKTIEDLNSQAKIHKQHMMDAMNNHKKQNFWITAINLKLKKMQAQKLAQL